MVSAQPIEDVDKRSLVRNIFNDVAGLTGKIYQDAPSIVNGLKTGVSLGVLAFKDLKCAAENFTGIKKAPHTNGIEWYENAEYLAGLAINNGIAEYLKQQTTLTVENIVKGAEAQGTDFLVEFAGHLGLSSEVAKLSNATFPIVNNQGTANAVDGIINTTIKLLEQAGVQIAVTGLSTVLAPYGVGFLVAPSQQVICIVGSTTFNVATSLEACTLNINPISQVLSEMQILFKNSC
ncbi:hypothetical protein QA089_003842 [Meyerozyma guilliermondii]